MKKEFEFNGWTVWFNDGWGASLSRKGERLIIISAASEKELKENIENHRT